MVSLPSFAQGPICLGGYWNGSACIFSSNPPNNNPWGGSGSSATTPHPWSYGCAGFNCDSADDYYDDSYDDDPYCSAYERADLIERRGNIPGCIGDPGINFDEIAWLEDFTSGFWYWFTNDFGRDWDDAVPSLVVLGDILTQNNGDLYAASNGFQTNLHQACVSNYVVGSDDFNDCMADAAYILDNYYPGMNYIAAFINWFAGTSFEVTDYSGTWGGVFVTDLTNFNACHSIYVAWEEEGCTGTP